MAECAASAYPGRDRRTGMPSEQQRPESQRLSKSPIEGSAGSEDLAPPIDGIRFTFGRTLKPSGTRREASDDLLQRFRADRGWRRFAGICRLKNRGRFVETIALSGLFLLGSLDLLESHLQPQLKLRL